MSPNFYLIGSRIREARNAAKLSQAELAELAEVSPQFISLVENGRKQVSLKVLLCIADALSVPLDQLVRTKVTGSVQYGSREVAELLSGCSAYERRVLIEVAAAVKRSLQNNRYWIDHIV